LTSPVHVVGASGRSGQALLRALLGRGVPVVPVVRSLERWRASGLPGAARLADLTDSLALRQALAGAERVVSCAYARYTAEILAAAPADARFVLLGSTRRYTRWPDPIGLGVLQGETALLASGRPGVMLHPTMIYGAEGENNVQPLAALLRRLPVVPLPGGGRGLVQPIYQDDVTRSIVAALDVAWTQSRTLVIAGPAPLPYAQRLAAWSAHHPGRTNPPPAGGQSVRHQRDDCHIGRSAGGPGRGPRSHVQPLGTDHARDQPHRRISCRDDRMAP
jgi:uncharacterized protein YbjT (DUF2867 family)